MSHLDYPNRAVVLIEEGVSEEELAPLYRYWGGIEAVQVFPIARFSEGYYEEEDGVRSQETGSLADVLFLRRKLPKGIRQAHVDMVIVHRDWEAESAWAREFFNQAWFPSNGALVNTYDKKELPLPS